MNESAHTLLRLLLCLLVAAVCGLLPARAQNDARLKEQKAKIARLEKEIAREEENIRKLRQSKSSAKECIRRVARQISNRNRLIEETEKELDLINEDIRTADRKMKELGSSLESNRRQYAVMVREAYRNYQHNNFLTYLFASKDFEQVARKLTILREMSAARRNKMEQIHTENEEITRQRAVLTDRKASLDKVSDKLAREKKNLQKEINSAQASIKQLSSSERRALSRKNSREQELDSAIAEMRRLTKGNKEGDSFSRKTTGLRLPVAGGNVKRYMGNMAEITGPKGAQVISIYTGKVVEIRRNRINNHYDVYVAHGEYISTYANLSSVCVEKGAKVARNQRIGTIGSSLDISTMNLDYRIIFGIYPPDESTTMNARDCFRK